MPTKEKPAMPLEEFRERVVSIPEIDWARLAAFIDGEGSIVIGKAKPIAKFKQKSTTYSLAVSITNTSEKLIAWLNHNFGGSVHSKPPDRNWGRRPIWQWFVQEKQADIILQKCLPYFIIKREQAEIGIAFCTLKSRGTPRFVRVSEESLQQREELRNKIHLLNSPQSAKKVG
jgi:hypothetical protein